MNFTDLYNRVFIKEQPSNNEVADPADFDDVKPAPLPRTDLATDDLGLDASNSLENDTVATSSNLTDYITQLEEFANKLNSTDGSSLNSLVSKLDRVETPFEGIYGRTSADIVDAAKTLRSVSEKLKNFIIHAAKK